MDVPWRIELLGGLKILGNGRAVARFRTQKAAGLLAYLAYHLGSHISREILIETFWPESDPEVGRHNLRNALSSLRGHLELPGDPATEALLADHATVRLNPDVVTTDVREFREAVRLAKAAASESDRLAHLERAVLLYTGPLLLGRYEDWALQAQAEIAETYFQALRQLLRLLEDRGDVEGAIPYAKAAVGFDPLREDVRRDLMRLLATAGQPHEALRQYHDLEQAVRRELGMPPEDATRNLAEDIRQQGSRPAVAPPASPLTLKHAPSFPKGTATLLVTEIEPGSDWRTIHDALEHFGGKVVREAGGSLAIAFASASDAIYCAAATHDKAIHGGTPARMALHTGDRESAKGGYPGSLLHHASLLLAATHHGQILCSEETAVLLRHHLEPGWKLADLGPFRFQPDGEEERLFQVEYPGMASQSFPPPDAPPAWSGYLPATLTRFLGRERQIGTIHDLLRRGARLITLVGPGGSGKTRLAIEAVRPLMAQYTERVWFVSLCDVRSPGGILDAVLDTLCLPRLPQGDPHTEAVEFLSQWPSLLVLDNLEHLVDGGKPLIQRLLDETPGLRVIVTSRRRLGLQGEHEMPVPPLQTPPESLPGQSPDANGLSRCDSVRLFLDRAQAVRLDFRLTDRNAAAVSELCRRLEGLPLAIEQAAARVGTCTVSEILECLSNRLDLMAPQQIHVSERHRSLRATLGWSYRLLSPAGQRLFAELSIFRGGFTAAAAAAVCTAESPIEALSELRENSLIVAADDGPEMRFHMLETVREYAHEQLGPEESRSLRARLVAFMLGSLYHGDGPLETGVPEWLDRMAADELNLHLACETAIRDLHDVVAGVRIAELLWEFWQVRGCRPEDCRRLAALLDEVHSDSAEWEGRARNTAGQLLKAQADLPAARSHMLEALRLHEAAGEWVAYGYTEESLAEIAYMQGNLRESLRLREHALSVFRRFDDTWPVAMVLVSMANVLTLMGETRRARNLADQSLRMFRALQSERAVATVLSCLANIAWFEGDLDASECFEQESFGLRRRFDEKWGIGFSMWSLARIAAEQGQMAKASTGYAEALRVFRGIGDPWAGAMVLHHMGVMEYHCGRPGVSQSLLLDALRTRQRLGDRWGVLETCQVLGVVAGALGDVRRSVRLLGHADVRREAQGYAVSSPCLALLRRATEAGRAALGEEGFRTTWSEGFHATLDELTGGLT